MTRRPLPRHRAWLVAGALLLPMLGCGGTSSVSVGVPTDNNGPPAGGVVSMPNGEVAQAPSLVERVALAIVARVEALVNGSVRPVGPNVAVRLVRIGPGNVVNGQIVHNQGAVVYQTTTAADGGYGVKLPTGTDANTCRFLVEVGSAANRTLTRAFVYGEHVDVDFQSEATVRLILEQIKAGEAGLCDFSADEIRQIHDAVASSENEAFGESASTVNASAVVAAAADPAVGQAIAVALGQVTPPPPATQTGTATPPATATGPIATATVPPPTRTNTAIVGGTSTATATASRVPTRTATPEATSTSTTVPTNTVPAPTNTVPAPTNTVPAPTNTVPAPTNTVPAPTNTVPVPTSTATVVPTTTQVPPSATVTHTNTPAATATGTPTSTATQAPPEVNVGTVAATAGLQVDVPVVLVTNGAAIAAVSNDIEYDGAQVTVAGSALAPDCTADARLAGKRLVARVLDRPNGRKLLRVGIIGEDNNSEISSGPLYVCRFSVDSGASGAVDLLNTPEASSPAAVPVAVVGSHGRIDVTAAPASLVLGTASAKTGETVEITGTLLRRGQSLAAVATDIALDSGGLAVADENTDGAPDCVAAAAAIAAGKQVIARQLDAPARLRVGVIGNGNALLTTSDDPAALFTCRFVVQATSGTIALPHVPEAASPAAAAVGLLAEPGSVTVVP